MHTRCSQLVVSICLIAAAFIGCTDRGVGASPEASTAPALQARSGTLTLQTQAESGAPLPLNVPELLALADKAARGWRRDAIAVMLEFEQRDAPNPAMRGPQIRIGYRSPSDGAGHWVYITSTEARSVDVRGRVTWGELSLPPVFIDLPVAVRKAREKGMRGAVSTATLRIWKPNGSPIAAWMLSVKGGNGRTIDATTGNSIDSDVTGYIAQYNAQMDKAARALRALLRGSRGHGPAGTFGGDSSPGGGGSDAPYDDGSQARAEYERNAAEARAYWQYDAADYSRIKNGECTWSDSSNIGC